MLNSSVSALVSSTSCEASLALQSLADTYNVPHIAIPKDICPVGKSSTYTVSIRPSFYHLSAATLALVANLSWTEFIIFYDSDSGELTFQFISYAVNVT